MDQKWVGKVFEQHDALFRFIQKKVASGQLTDTEFHQIYSEPIHNLMTRAGYDKFFPVLEAYPVLRHATHVIRLKLLEAHPQWESDLDHTVPRSP